MLVRDQKEKNRNIAEGYLSPIKIKKRLECDFPCETGPFGTKNIVHKNA